MQLSSLAQVYSSFLSPVPTLVCLENENSSSQPYPLPSQGEGEIEDTQRRTLTTVHLREGFSATRIAPAIQKLAGAGERVMELQHLSSEGLLQRCSLGEEAITQHIRVRQEKKAIIITKIKPYLA